MENKILNNFVNQFSKDICKKSLYFAFRCITIFFLYILNLYLSNSVIQNYLCVIITHIFIFNCI